MLLCNLPNVDLNLSRRVYTEEKPKVVAAVWGAELIYPLDAVWTFLSAKKYFFLKIVKNT